jgi:hypothetical protein
LGALTPAAGGRSMAGMPTAALRPALAFAATLLLAGCGGGLSIGIGIGGDWDVTPPAVSLAVPPGPVRAGGTLRVAAAATDADSGIDIVTFFREDRGAWVRLGFDATAPYEWDVPVPNDGRSTVSVYAEATDGVGLRANSAVVTVDVTP